MRMTQADQVPPNCEPHADSGRPARDLPDSGRDKRKRDSIHPCLRALPDYPAR